MPQPPNETGIYNTPQPPDNGGVCKTPLRSPSQTVGAIVRGYKSSVTKRLGLLGFNGKLWQRNYYEHIIRNEQSYQNISNYIINNPAKWQADKFYSK
jgi:REP element-mobilizing transposase RayT